VHSGVLVVEDKDENPQEDLLVVHGYRLQRADKRLGEW